VGLGGLQALREVFFALHIQCIGRDSSAAGGSGSLSAANQGAVIVASILKVWPGGRVDVTNNDVINVGSGAAAVRGLESLIGSLLIGRRARLRRSSGRRPFW